MSSKKRTSILDLKGLVGLQGVIDSINKLESAINKTASYLFADNKTPSGLINSSNKVFTLPSNPNPNGSLRLYLGGDLQVAGGSDYTLSGVTITFVTAPATGKTLRAFYRYK